MVPIDFLIFVIYITVSSKKIHVCLLHRSIHESIYIRRLFLFGPLFEYGIDRQLTKYTSGSATVVLNSRLGVLLRLKFVDLTMIYH